jgi:hypothetical protein
MRPSSRLFHVAGLSKNDQVKANAPRRPLPSIDVEIEGHDSTQPSGVTGEAWHKARGWASED